jgi:hypothetical protein
MVFENIKKVEGVDVKAITDPIEDCANKVILMARGRNLREGKVELSEVQENLVQLK